MYRTKGYPIDFDLRDAGRSRVRERGLLRRLAARLRRERSR